MFSTVVHQTLQDLDNADHVEEHGPFKATSEKSYLGLGYYFWDDHIELAKFWGEVHCKNNYIICEADFELSYDYFLDLVGNRQNQKYFHEVAQMLGAQTWSMGKIIEFLKDLEKKPERKGIFPYKAVRAVDINDSKFKPTNYRFVEGQLRYVNMNPRLIICLFEKNKLILTTYKIIYPEKYVQPD